MLIHATLQSFSHEHLSLGGIVNQASGMDRSNTELTKTETKGKRTWLMLVL